jgi:cell division protein FtsZ
LTKGKGAGGVPEKGQKAAEESSDEITRLLAGTDMVFITAGMGAVQERVQQPVIAALARELGILTVE